MVQNATRRILRSSSSTLLRRTIYQTCFDSDYILNNFQPIRAIAKEFAQNKKIKPADYTTEAYDKNDAKNRQVYDLIHFVTRKPNKPK
ncbi:hypothetical protein Y032_0052g2185 [Ancylostoma ceylanicum]|uniref:Uncharacterized protein n=1 Tax=Ancylostoma ceylanicum TaxID=53326 RepID=A0A016U830_9BILA|nr:hypothetical protein Y032_0052g2185 [Ancylostoma ceylanicum]